MTELLHELASVSQIDDCVWRRAGELDVVKPW